MRGLCFLAVALIVSLLPSMSTGQMHSLTVGYASITVSQTLLHVVKDAGIFARYGLKITPVLLGGGTRAAMSLVAGDVKILFMGAPAIVNPIAQGMDAVIVAGITNRLDFAFITYPEIKKPEDLKGQTIASGPFGSTADFYVRYLLGKWNLDPKKDVTVLQIGIQPLRFAALRSGQVKGTIIQPPNTLLARKIGFHELVRADEVDFPFQVAAVVSTRSFIKSHKGIVKDFMKALVEGIHYYKHNPGPSMGTIARHMKLDDIQLAEEAYRFYSKAVPSVPYPTIAGLRTVLDEMGRKDLQVRKLKAEDLVDVDILRELEREGFVDKLYGGKR